MLMAADIDVTAVLAGDCDLPADFQEANLFNLYQDHVEHEQLQILQDICDGPPAKMDAWSAFKQWAG